MKAYEFSMKYPSVRITESNWPRTGAYPVGGFENLGVKITATLKEIALFIRGSGVSDSERNPDV